jgi:hypothetical protein
MLEAMNKLATLPGMVLGLALLSPQLAHADDKSQRAAALELLALMDIKHTMEQATEAMLAAQIAANPQLEAAAPKMRQYFAKYMSWQALQEDFVTQYVKAFSEAELKDLLKFYKTPLGKKSLQQSPKIMENVAQLGAQRVQDHIDELMKSLNAPAK